MKRKEFIKKYIDFFESKDHKKIPNSSLIPKDDPTTLFISAGMQPLVPYLLGKKHSLGKKLVNVQKCIRTTDIEKVGNRTHHTFFEMLGNWSLGDYWKKEAIELSFEFLTKELKIPKEKISVTCFKGERKIPKDIESEKVWSTLGIKKIKFLGKKDNWWGPAGKTGPCGPDTEIFVNGVEIWNDVFMQYNKNEKEEYKLLKQKNVDTGMGVERMLALLNGLEDNYLTDVWQPIIKEIEKLSGKKYENLSSKPKIRIIADHVKAAVFIIANGISPSNTGQGYVLRRLIRRAIRYGRELGMKNFTNKIAEPIFKIYDDYSELKTNKRKILNELEKEEERFLKTLERGEIFLKKKIKEIKPSAFSILKKDKKKQEIPSKDAFLLYQSYGFPIESIEETAQMYKIKVDIKAFQKEFAKHQKLSKMAAKGKFSSGLADNSEKTTKLHTATHLLNEALKQVLGKDVKQKGSNITSERLRFDFNFPRKLTEKEIKKTEDLVNAQISKGLKVSSEEMPLKKALSSSKIQSEFGARYPKVVSVYSIGKFSKEICTGPHVKNTKDIGKFKITKEQSSAAGIRRIKAVVE